MSKPLSFYIYDLETLKNFFSFSGKFLGNDTVYTYEISSRRNQRSELLAHLSYVQNTGAHMVGFNSLGFDYPILHNLLNNIHTFTYQEAYQLCKQIIGSQGSYGNDNLHAIWLQDRLIPQIDLVKLNHFDNANKRTPLKSLQVAMRLPSVEDIPVKMDVDITPEQMDIVLKYNVHDVTSTEEFLKKCMHLIDLRKELLDTGVLSGDVLNYSDVKLGTEYLVKKIGRAKCFNGNKPKQTIRSHIPFKDLILPKIEYRTEPYQVVLDWFNSQSMYVGAEEKPHYEKNLAGVEFHFGVGGVHASVENRSYVSDDVSVIKDLDVTGMYVSVAIANEFIPAHLGKDFSMAYKQLQQDRAQYPKGSTMNAVLKLAGNGVFGNSDNPFSCFYDPYYPKQITINGQLQILQLVEKLSLIAGVEIIQANTDGITVYMPRSVEGFFQMWKNDWEQNTGLKLEEVEYDKMFIKDVNNYIAVTKSGKIKSKGAYWYPKQASDYDGAWNKDFSMMVVQKVTELALVNDWNPVAFIRSFTDPFDFMLRTKANSGATLFLGDNEMQKTVRYFISKTGEKLVRHSKPKGLVGDYKRKTKMSDEEFNAIKASVPDFTWDERIHTKNKSKYEIVKTEIEKGYLVTECNDASKFDWSNLNWDYYLNEINKLMLGAAT